MAEKWDIICFKESEDVTTDEKKMHTDLLEIQNVLNFIMTQQSKFQKAVISKLDLMEEKIDEIKTEITSLASGIQEMEESVIEANTIVVKGLEMLNDDLLTF